jgi:OmpA-OmpF porin, OOP family
MQSENLERITKVGPSGAFPGIAAVGRGSVPFDAGGVGVASIGYGLGNGLRIEAEGDYRYNSVGSSFTNNAREQKFGGMANVLFDLDVGSPYIFPYVGAGAGYMWVDRSFGGGVNPSQTGSFAYQAIAGVALPLPWVPGLSATLEYRFMGLAGAAKTDVSSGAAFPSGSSFTQKFSDDYNHSILLGVRYAFNTAPPPPPPAPVVPQAQVAPARTYLVFFDWDRSDLTDRARQIIAEAAQASTHVQYTKIDVQGNADRSGTPAYNQGLSLRRAQTVAAELVRQGVPSTAIDIQAFGDTHPLVPTAAGVREPQNRRVAIILQ